MRIAILTHPLRYNYGAILQNFALQTVLRRMGHEVVTLDPKRYEYSWGQHVLFIIQHAIGKYLLGHRHTQILEQWNHDRKTRLLGRNTFAFIDRYIQRKDIKNLVSEIKQYDFDAFVVGSDQVWRPECFSHISNMFLDFTEGWNVKRIAYAASFGIDSWNASKETTAYCKKLIRQFDFVSVREDSGVSICNDTFGTKAIHVLDPSTLLMKEDYCSILELDKIAKSKGNLLVYILDYTDDKIELIKRISERYRLVPFRVNSDVENYQEKELDKKIQPPVEQWLRGFYDADYVITDSFHACAFSVIFDKPFVVYINEFRGATRYRSLWNLLALDKGMISKTDDVNGFCSLSQFSKSRLMSLHTEALRLLQQTLEK